MAPEAEGAESEPESDVDFVPDPAKSDVDDNDSDDSTVQLKSKAESRLKAVAQDDELEVEDEDRGEARDDVSQAVEETEQSRHTLPSYGVATATENANIGAAKKSFRRRHIISDDEDEKAGAQAEDPPPSYDSSAGDKKITHSHGETLPEQPANVSSSDELNVQQGGKQSKGTAKQNASAEKAEKPARNSMSKTAGI